MPSEQEIYAMFITQVDGVLLRGVLSAPPAVEERWARARTELEPWLRKGAHEVAAEPDRLPEAMQNLEKLLAELKAPKFAMGGGGRGFKNVRELFDWVCPMWPFC